MNFRTDINALRALAVSIVVLFHFGVPGFSGGFLGVDVFFVISGYLMTQILWINLEDKTKKFRISDFYLSRAVRILPALIVLTCFLLILGWFFLPSIEYKTLADHAGRSILFISNFKFFKEVGYFDAAAHEKWLLHTWSLSVEWQFYLILPILIWLFLKISRNIYILKLIFLIISAISLYYSITTSSIATNGAFWLLKTRAWEMLIGGIVFLLSMRKKPSGWLPHIMAGLGLSMIIISVYWLRPFHVWPGYLALIPVIGTALILLAKVEWHVFNFSPIQKLGNISYSVYLWHWPVAVLLYYTKQMHENHFVILGILLSILLGYISYQYIEEPSRRYFKKNSQKKSLIYLAILFLIPLAFMVAIRKNEGLPHRLPNIEYIFSEKVNYNQRAVECSDMAYKNPCLYGDGPIPGAIVLGDSHAQSIVVSLSKALPSKDMHLVDMSMPGCTTIIGLKYRGGHPCTERLNAIVENIEKYPYHVPLVILNRIAYPFEGLEVGEVGYNHEQNAIPDRFMQPHESRSETFYSELHQAFVETMCTLAKNRPVYVIRPIPEMPFDVPNTMGRAKIMNEDFRISRSVSDYHKRNARAIKAQDAAAKSCGINLLDVQPFFCDTEQCWGDINGRPIYFDDDHLSLTGSDLLLPLFQSIFTTQTQVDRKNP